ncbi:uncharacterized protein PgNI_03268 [Pyricularia grisea]|uniref:Uncharacterized protein n=1 Tax=Pyricularia grisea TaxID=148305 RepID=A0A6P8BBR8_PYRGI|nr:uncharacterized protein PgNI_03268 [Pyricularia grisea]TLD13275.1 hypothetical protein PgNI_03268 [Pyricularia grisea]
MAARLLEGIGRSAHLLLLLSRIGVFARLAFFLSLCWLVGIVILLVGFLCVD